MSVHDINGMTQLQSTIIEEVIRSRQVRIRELLNMCLEEMNEYYIKCVLDDRDLNEEVNYTYNPEGDIHAKKLIEAISFRKITLRHALDACLEEMSEYEIENMLYMQGFTV